MIDMKLDINRLRAALAQEKTAIHCDTLEKAEAFPGVTWDNSPVKLEDIV